MSNIRLFIEGQIHSGQVIKLNTKQEHYIRNVMRVRCKQQIRIFNGKDGEWNALIRISDKQFYAMEVLDQTMTQTTEKELCLCCAVTKWKTLSNVIRQATELGATKIQLVLTDYTAIRIVDYNKLKIKMESCVIEAAEQCQRLSIPKIMSIITFYEMCQQYKHNLIICDETNQDNHPWDILPNMKEATIMIGPEGGLSFNEQKFKDVHRMNLGPQILRVDTAVVSALTYVHAFLDKQS